MFKNSEKGTSCRQILPALVWSKAALMIVVLFTVSLDGVTVFAHEAEDRPVVMFSSAPFRIPIADPIADGNEVDKFVPYTIYREIVRQAVMIIVREEFGLPTRDDSLLEPLDNTSKHYYEIDVVVHHLKSVTYTISQNGKVKFEKKFEFKVGSGTYHRFSTMMEKHSREDLIDFFKKEGYVVRGNQSIAPEESKPLAKPLELQLRTMNHLVQFRAVRELHRLMREEGETQERLSGLVRGYSNLSQMMFSTFGSRTEVFAARSMVYARRLRKVGKNSPYAVATDAYSDALLGFPSRARGHAKGSLKRCAEGNIEPADWLPLIESYCSYRNSEIQAVIDSGSSLREVAALLKFRSTLQTTMPDTPQIKDASAKAALKDIPTCLWIYDRMTYDSGVSSGHFWTRAAPRAMTLQLSENLPDWNELPDPVMQLIEAQGELAEQLAFNAFEAAKIANAMIAEAADDKQEPSYAVLGRNIEAWNVMHVYQRAYFSKYKLAVEVDNFLQQMEQVFSRHPDADLIRVMGISPDAVPDFLKNYSFKDGNYFSTRVLLCRLPPRETFANMPVYHAYNIVSDSSIRCEHYMDQFIAGYGSSALGWAYWSSTICPDAPIRKAALMYLDWEKNKQDFEDWYRDNREHPLVILTAARIKKKQGDFEQATKLYNDFLKVAPGTRTVRELAYFQFQNDDEDWQKTMERTFEIEDLGLSHSHAAATIALNLLYEGKFEAALPWAERSNQSGSSRGMICLIDCYTCLGRLDEASDLARARIERYPSVYTARFWFRWCAANEHEDLRESFKLLEKFTDDLPERDIANLDLDLEYFQYKGNRKRVTDILLKKLKPSFKPQDAFHLILESDLAGKTKLRDAVLRELLVEAEVSSSPYELVAPIIKDYFDTGRLDEAALDEKLSRSGAEDYHADHVRYMVTLLRLNREGENGKEKAIAVLSKPSHLTNESPIYPLFWLKLRELGVEPATLEHRVFWGCWSKKSKLSPEEMEAERQAWTQKAEAAREFEFDPKNNLKNKRTDF